MSDNLSSKRNIELQRLTNINHIRIANILHTLLIAFNNNTLVFKKFKEAFPSINNKTILLAFNKMTETQPLNQ